VASKAVKSDQDIDPEVFARWNNEGGAAGPIERGARRLIDEGAQNAHASVRTQTHSSVDRCH
jgi:hypothetical protein